MKRLIGLFAILCLILCACRSDDDTDEALRQFPSDEEVMRLAYDFTYTVPDNFLVDERADTPGSYTIYHVKDESISYELCSNSDTEALAWESTDNAHRVVNGAYVELLENDRYFEVVRELEYSNGIGNISDPTSPGFSRVFKCSYANRDGVDRNVRNGFAGILNARPLSEDVMRTYVEYLWQFTFFWPQQKTVLDSFSKERPDKYEHTLMLAFITNQGFEKCDLIEVVDWVFTVEKGNGQVTKDFILLYEFEAQLINRHPQRCD